LTSPPSSSNEPRKSAANNRASGTVIEVLAGLTKADLGEAWRFWAGESPGKVPGTLKKLRQDVAEWMGDSPRVLDCVENLRRSELTVHDMLLAAPHFELTMGEIVGAKDLAYLSSYELEASLELLRRRGLVQECASRRVSSDGVRSFAICQDLGNTLLGERRARRRGIFDALTLRGHLDRMYDDPERAARTPPARVRELYKLYSNEASCVSRIERLPEGLQNLMRKVVMEFGGILPKAFFDRMDTDLPHWNGLRWGKILEESLVGTLENLDLGRYGIGHSGETLIVFNEVTLAWLKRVAVPGDPDAPHDKATMGVDLVANVTRFLAFIVGHNVRFTAKGELFKTTGKRILKDLIPNPGREVEREEVLNFIYSFARYMELIEPTGMRTFALTAEGRCWDERTLDDKLQALFDFIIEEPAAERDSYHQARLRHILVTLTKRIDPGVWYDLMYLPFLARNNYLCRLDELGVDEYFEGREAPRSKTGEDLQRLSWSLVRWLRQRMHLLGLVDLGYDGAGHPVAMRLTPTGARLLGVDDPDRSSGGSGNLVITPDFEVVLFPTEDDASLIHDLDRFCERSGEGDLKHFKISSSSLHRALIDGMSLSRMIETLEWNSRVPVPQNVLYSIRDWAAQAGLMRITQDLVVHCADKQCLKGFVQDPGVRSYVDKVLDGQKVQLKDGVSPARMRVLLRELSYLVELE
jgi:hypothetical protein